MDGKFLIRGKGVHIWLGVCLCFLEFCSYAPVYILLLVVNVPKTKETLPNFPKKTCLFSMCNVCGNISSA